MIEGGVRSDLKHDEINLNIISHGYTPLGLDDLKSAIAYYKKAINQESFIEYKLYYLKLFRCSESFH